jgi:hypothetical protein
MELDFILKKEESQDHYKKKNIYTSKYMNRASSLPKEEEFSLTTKKPINYFLGLSLTLFSPLSLRI